MPDIAVSLRRVSKRYRRRRGHLAATLRGEASRLVRGLLRSDWTSPSDFWALRDVSFEIKVGETVGLIGCNGAGKSTTLKILSRVTVPTSGTFTVHGRLGALIEVGAGFHPELTGRENIYLNGGILGMRRPEVDAKFDRIVAFAEIEPFLDLPTKRYSSGMEVRLGFSIAAHVDPDVLLVDEVLAVGDAAFQVKCLNKLAELREQARTVVLVSHNMANIVQHCDRVIWIDRGRLRACGEPEAIAEQYLRTSLDSGPDQERPGPAEIEGPLRISGVRVTVDGGRSVDVLQYGRPASLEIDYAVVSHFDDPVVEVAFHDGRGLPLGGMTTRFGGFRIDLSRPEGRLRLVMDPVLFTRGAYTVSVSVLDARLQRRFVHLGRAASFTVEGPSVASREVTGHVVYPHRWEKAK